MIVAEENVEIVRGGSLGEEKALRIKASPKAFKVLSDKLYSDKIKAIIRELSCNAYDAHVSAGKGDAPFTVTLPNTLNPNFVVSDNGTGISPQDIDDVFTVFFETTKASSNDFVGCMGLGCKSPLCYTESFVVESFIDGKKYSYSIYKNEVGIPSCTLMSSEDTDEPSGLRITIPVGSHDFNSFSEKAKSVFTHFKVKPIVNGNAIQIPEKEYYISTENFGLRKRDWNGAKAIMGNVCYPLSDLRDDSLTDVEQDILNLDVDIFFDIGELDVSASRESLSYDKVTVQHVKNKLAIIESTLQSALTKKIEDCENLWEARLTYKKIITQQNLSSVCENLKVFYKNNELQISAVDLASIRFPATPAQPLDNQSQDALPEMKKPNFVISTYTLNRTKLKSGSSSGSIPVDEDNLFIIDDVDSDKIKNRIRNYIEDHNAYVFYFYDNEYIEKVRKILGIEAFIKLSDIPVVKPQRYSTGSSSRGYSPYNPKYMRKEFLFTPDKYDGSANSSYWTAAQIKEDEVVYYVKIDRFKVNGSTNPASYIQERMNTLSEAGQNVENFKVYGVKFGGEISPLWVELDAYVKQVVNEFVKDNPDYIDFLVRQDYGLKSQTRLPDSLRHFSRHLISVFPENKDLDTIYRYVESDSAFHCCRKYADYDAEEMYKKMTERAKKISQAIDNINQTYPLVGVISYHYISEEVTKEIEFYMKMIDQKNEEEANSVAA